MRWPCFLLLASLPLASATTAQTTGSASSPKSLTFDVAQVPATRDSFVFRLRGQERGWAVWQYEIRPLEMTQEVVYTAASEFRPVGPADLDVSPHRSVLAGERHRDGGARPGSEAGGDLRPPAGGDEERWRDNRTGEPPLRPGHRPLGLRVPRRGRIERRPG